MGAAGSISLGRSGGKLARAWWKTDAVLDADFAQGRFFHQGTTFGSVEGWRAAVGGVLAGGVTSLGPLAVGSELLSNGDFSGGDTGWSGQLSGTIAVAGGELTLTGNGGNAPAASHAVSVSVGRAYQLRGKVKRGATGTLNVVAGVSHSATLSGMQNFGGSQNVTTTTYAEWVGTFSMFQSTAYVGMRAVNNPANGTMVMDEFSVREVVPFSGFSQGEFSVLIAATTPASSAVDKVLWQADDNAISGTPIAKNFIRVVWDSTGHLRLVVGHQTNALASLEQANLDLGVVGANVAFRIALSAKADMFCASLDGRPAVVDISGVFPGVAAVRIGGSQASANAWNGEIARVSQFPKAKSKEELEALSAPSVRHLIAAWGDSLTGGSGASGGHNYPSLVSGLFTPPRAVANKGVGGETSTQIRDRFLADAGLKLRTVLIWPGRNNYADKATVLADIAAMVAAMGHDRFLVGSVLNGNYATEYLGQAAYLKIVSLNADLAAQYGARFVDLRGPLIAAGDPVGDASDIARDIVPGSLRSDEVHLNDAGYAIVAAAWVAAINSKGW